MENGFGIMCSRFICLSRTVFAKPDKVRSIVAACVALHNYLLNKTRDTYATPGFTDSFAADGTLIEGGCRQTIPQNSMFNSRVNFERSGRATDSAKSVRDQIRNYLNSPYGSLAWQYCHTYIHIYMSQYSFDFFELK